MMGEIAKKGLIFLIIVLLIPTVFAQFDSTLYSYGDLYLNIDVSSDIFFTQQKQNYKLNYVQSELAFYPAETYRQSIVSFETDPETDTHGDYVVFSWTNPPLDDISYGIEAQVHTTNEFYKVTNKIVFPMLDIPTEQKYYLQTTELIDINSDIEDLAEGLANGERDAYIVTWKIADWVKNNIEYDLNTITAEASLPSSWVLQAKQGVCDELTSLFISMLRSVGIPARFVTGMAFTTSTMFAEQFGPHGWAEVYFPGYGWVPFDVTYGQYGFLDATHIKLKDSLDSDRSSVRYEWESYGVDVSTGDLDMHAYVADTGELAELPYNFEAEVLYPELSFGSYNIIEVDVRNTNGYYVPVILYLSKSSGYNAVEGYERSAILKPEEETSLHWLIQVDPTLSDDYEYFFEGMIYTVTNESSAFSFSSQKTDPTYTFSEVRGVLQDIEQETQMEYSKDISLSCFMEDSEFYAEYAPVIQCTIQNTGNTVQEDIDVCYEKECETMDLGIADSEEIEFSLNDLEIGRKTVKISARNRDMFKTSSLSYTVLDQPKVIIQEISYSKEVELGQESTISFLLEKDSLDMPRNVDVNVDYGKITQKVFKELLEDKMEVNVDIQTNDLLDEENTIFITIYYEDESGTKFTEQEDISIKLLNLSFWDKVKMFLKRLF